MCSWLRLVCVWLKRFVCEEIDGWDVFVSEYVKRLCYDLIDKVFVSDLVRGIWSVSLVDDGEWVVFCDAFEIAIGVVF